MVAKKLSSCERSCESVLRAKHFIQIFLPKIKFMEPGKRAQHHASTYVNNVAGTCVHVCAHACVCVSSAAVVLGHTAVLLQMSSKMVRFQVRCCHLAPVSFSEHRCMAARAAQPHLRGQTRPNFLAVEKRGEHSIGQKQRGFLCSVTQTASVWNINRLWLLRNLQLVLWAS